MSTHWFYRLWYKDFIQCCRLNMILTFYVCSSVCSSTLQGRTFGSMIKNFLMLSQPLNETYLPQYNTTKGREYTLVNQTWPTDWSSVWVNRANYLIIFYCPLSFRAGQIYNDTLESVKNSFPQYIRELEGVADGAEVEFHKVRYNTQKNYRQPPIVSPLLSSSHSRY